MSKANERNLGAFKPEKRAELADFQVIFAVQAFENAGLKITDKSTVPQIERAYAKGMKTASLVEGRETALTDARAILIRAAGGRA